jgi:hypothetical protein
MLVGGDSLRVSPPVKANVRGKLKIMEAAGFILIGLGLIIYLVGGIQFLIAECRESIWWLLGGLIFPIISLVFLCVHFHEAWPSTKMCLIGFLIVLAGVLLPELRSIML